VTALVGVAADVAISAIQRVVAHVDADAVATFEALWVFVANARAPTAVGAFDANLSARAAIVAIGDQVHARAVAVLQRRLAAALAAVAN
jgi:hypothetical protein